MGSIRKHKQVFSNCHHSLTLSNIGNSEPENYSPILVQTMMKRVVEANGDRRAIVSCDGKIDWTYNQYYQEVHKAAKGFISLGKSTEIFKVASTYNQISFD